MKNWKTTLLGGIAGLAGIAAVVMQLNGMPPIVVAVASSIVAIATAAGLYNAKDSGPHDS